MCIVKLTNQKMIFTVSEVQKRENSMSFPWPWTKTRDMRCPDGTTRTIYKNIDDACPLFIPGFKADISGDIKGAAEFSGKVGAKYETDVKGLLFSLNEQNQSLMMSFRTVYLTFSSNPCGNDAFFKREIEKLLDEQRKISTLKIKIAALIQLALSAPDDSNRMNLIYSEIASLLGGSAVAQAASLEIVESREVAVQMLTGEHDDH